MIKNLSILFFLLFVGFNSFAQEAAKSSSGSGIVKNGNRLIAGVGGGGEDAGLAFKVAYEALGLQKKIGMLSGLDNAGIGFASNNITEIFLMRDNGGGSADAAYWSKHYLSAYLFKEFDTKVVTFGLLGGVGLNYTKGRYEQGVSGSKTETDVSFFTGGIHTGEYIQRYLGKNSKGEKTFFIRLGMDQFFMAKGSSVLGAFLSLGF